MKTRAVALTIGALALRLIPGETRLLQAQEPDEVTVGDLANAQPKF
jgi:hypothetical protein